MITKLFSYWKKSKQQQAVDLALKLENLLNEIGRVPAKNGECASIRIYEFSHTDLHQLDTDGFKIQFNQKGEIVK